MSSFVLVVSSVVLNQLKVTVVVLSHIVLVPGEVLARGRPGCG